MTPARRSSLLAQADSDELVALADAILHDHAGAVAVVRPPEIGLRTLVVREPIERIRVNLADVMVTEAEVLVGTSPGWATRLGSDREATLAAAILDGFATQGADWSDEIENLCATVERRIQEAEQAVRSEVAGTEVRFEELD